MTLMLESLNISNYALIDHMEINFHAGLNIITGETGAGKSIMLGALSLIMGGRADTKAIKSVAQKSVIEAVFEVSTNTQLKQYCIDNDVEWDDNKCILRREILPSGRSRAFINDSPVSLTLLQGVAIQLIDIHSQHQNQLLAQPEFQRNIIDSLAANGELKAKYLQRYNALRTAVKALKQAKTRIAKSKENEEFLQFQLEKLKELSPVAGEQEELERNRDNMANIAQIKSSIDVALDAIENENFGILHQIECLQDAISALDNAINAEANIPERLETIRIELNDILGEIQTADENLHANPEELDYIEQRLESIYDLERKHDVETVEELISIQERLQSQLNELNCGDETIHELEKTARRSMALARQTAAELTDSRVVTAEKFGTDLLNMAKPLGMKNLIVDIKVSPADMSIHGMDNVEFLFAFNKNQKPTGVAGAASGGEISRLMLAIKSIIASQMQLPSIIFDEVDTGVSGDVANRMGEMMKRAAENIQVIAITHLPQVAAKGTSHFKVFKEDDEDATHTRIFELDQKQRIAELALMLSGDQNNPTAQATALHLLSQNDN